MIHVKLRFWIVAAVGALGLLLLVGFWLLPESESEARKATPRSRSVRRDRESVPLDPAALRRFAHRHALLHRLMWGFCADAPALSGPALETRYLIFVRAMRDGVSITDERLREALKSPVDRPSIVRKGLVLMKNPRNSGWPTLMN